MYCYFPDHPKEFLVEQIEKLQKAKATKREFPCLFDDSNIQSVFGMLDPTGKGFITHQQYLEGNTFGFVMHLNTWMMDNGSRPV